MLCEGEAVYEGELGGGEGDHHLRALLGGSIILLILILYNIFYTIFFIQLLFLKDIFYTAFIFFTAHRNLRLLYCTVLHYLYCITVRSAATQTTLWGSPGPRFEPRTDDL